MVAFNWQFTVCRTAVYDVFDSLTVRADRSTRLWMSLAVGELGLASGR